MDNQQLDEMLSGFAMSTANSDATRAQLWHRPSDVGLAYEDVTFASQDGVPLEGWIVSAKNPRGLIIANHPMSMSRSGQPTQLSPWCEQWGPSGNGFEVNFVPDIKILHDAGYTVFTYDLRNHGLSGTGNGGVNGSGWFEARDVIGSLRFARSRADLSDLPLGLLSRCLGANSTFAAMTQHPEEFADVRALVGIQPVQTRTVNSHMLAMFGVSAEQIEEALDLLDDKLRLHTSLGYADRDTHAWARNVTAPTYLVQVHDDTLTEPADVQTSYDNLPVADKHLHWVRDTTARWDGYLEFQRRPQPILDWFAGHLG